MLIRSNIKFFWRCFLKVSMRLSQCAALSVSCDRKMEKNSRLWRCLLGIIKKLIYILWLHSAWPFQTDALNLVYDYLSNRKQTVKLNETFICWKDIEYGVPKGSVLGPLLFNIHLCGLLYFLEDLDIASYADYTTIYTVKEYKESVINTLKVAPLPLFTWFKNNFMKTNIHKCCILLSGSEPSATLIDSSSTERDISRNNSWQTLNLMNMSIISRQKKLMFLFAVHFS